MAFDTVANIVSDAAVECGLGTVSDVFASTDGNVVQLRAYLKQLGRKLWKRHDWNILIKTHTITTSAGDNDYNLPADYGRVLDQSGWNRTDRRPLSVVTPQEWQYLKSTNSGLLSTILFRIVEGEIQLWPDTDTPASLSLAFEYVSSYWVKPTAQAAPTLDAPTANSDVLYYPPEVLVLGLKAEFLGNKSMPTAAKAELDFEEALLDAIANDAPAGILSMGQRREEPMLSINNLPDTGYGS